MFYRKLRIAWSVAWCVLAMLLFALWVRSFWWVEQIAVRVSPRIVVGMRVAPGVIGLGYSTDTISSSHWSREPVQEWLDMLLTAEVTKLPSRSIWGHFYFDRTTAGLPIWLPLSLTITLAAAPWLRWRFSLRTLLIATTLVAVVLGLVVWLA